MKMKDVSGKLVLVTGGAMGIGKITARKFLDEGARVVLVDLNEKELKKAALEFKRAGGDVYTYMADVTDSVGIGRLADKIKREVGIVDVLINNAGVVIGGEFLDLPDDKIRLHYEVNVLGMIWLTRAFLPGMIAKGEGHVVNMASASGFLGVPYLAAYASSKWAVIGLTESLALEMEALGHKGIKFTAICPSYVSTGMFEGVKAPLMTPFLTPETMARKIYEAVVEEKQKVLEPLMVKFTPALKALTTPRIFNMLSNILGVTNGAVGWTGHVNPVAQKKAAGKKVAGKTKSASNAKKKTAKPSAAKTLKTGKAVTSSTAKKKTKPAAKKTRSTAAKT
jgi:all-trans-retinol dehydrogenase (NAD+)